MESLSNIIDSLEHAMDKAVERCIPSDGGRIAILFSGGLDSSLLARFFEDRYVDGVLYSVAMEGSHDFRHLRKAASFFKYELVFRTLIYQELTDYARKTIAASGSCKPLDVAIGIPLYAACEEAKKGGCETVIVGQGADELFAGYHRYLAMERNELEEALVRDLEKLVTTDIKRDVAIAEANSLQLRAPYLDEDFVKIAKTVPAEMKIKGGVRKFILRELSRRKKLPSRLYNREKKAVQYSTGVDKALRKIAKAEKKKIGEFLSSLG
jgi:asparagine synthase (glutamine-hydrolysing)